MENTKRKKFSTFRILSLIFICIFCACTFSSCAGMGRGRSSSSGGDGTTTIKPTRPAEPELPDLGGDKSTFTNANDVFLGAIGVYEVDGDSKVFYDNYSETLMSFNELVERQFETLSNIIYGSLDYIYGSSRSEGINLQFGNSNIYLEYSNFVNKNDFMPDSDAINCGNAVNGGYELVVNRTAGEPDPDTGDISYTYSYNYNTNAVVSENAWKSSLYFSKDNIKKALKYIYFNPSRANATSLDFNFSDMNLKNYYIGKQMSDFDGSSLTFDTIGFSKEYIWNVLYFLSYTVIGEDNINNSMDYHNVVDTTITDEYVYNNHDAFEKYKGYHFIVKEIVTNAFNLTTNGINSNGITLFPNLYREQFLYYDDIEKIQDIQYDYDSSDSFEVPDVSLDGGDFDEDYEYEKTPVDGVNLRKLKRIILIPYLASGEFSIDYITFNMKTNSGDDDFEVAISWSGFAQGNSFKNIVPKFNDMDGASENVTVDGKLKIDDICYDTDLEEMSFTEDDMGILKFQSAESTINVGIVALIDNTFVSVDGEDNVKYTKVYNNLFSVDISEKTYSINIGSNLINMDFKYYDESGNLLSSIPTSYLMTFGIGG